MVAVGAVGRTLDLAFYSTTGSYVEIAAPGGDQRQGGTSAGILQQTLDLDLLETYERPVSQFGPPRADAFAYYYFQGTSMATPHVVGLRGAADAAGHHQPGGDRSRDETIRDRQGRAGTRRLIRLRPDQPARDAARPGPGPMSAPIACRHRSNRSPSSRMLMSAGIDRRRSRRASRGRRAGAAQPPPPRGIRDRRLRDVRPHQLHRGRQLRRDPRRAVRNDLRRRRARRPAARRTVRRRRRVALSRRGRARVRVRRSGVSARHSGRDHRHADRDQRRLAVSHSGSCRSCVRTSAAASPRTATRRRRTSRPTPKNVDERFSGYHLVGGVEYKITRWLGVAGEVTWTTVPDAIGEAGVSAAFDETDLGGTTLPGQDHDRAMTPFERRVLTVVSRIPAGPRHDLRRRRQAGRPARRGARRRQHPAGGRSAGTALPSRDRRRRRPRRLFEPGPETLAAGRRRA